MSDLTVPAASSIALPAPAAPPSATAPNSSSQGDFCEVMNDKQFRPRIKPPVEGKGQDNAATGTDLPEKDKGVDPALAWLFGTPPVLVTVPTPIPPPPAATTEPPAMLEAAPDIAPDVLMASGAPAVIAAQANCDVLSAKPGMLTLPVVTPAASPVATPDAPPRPIKLPLLQPQLPADRAANAQPIAAALPALFALAMATDSSKRDDDVISSPTPAATPLSQPTTTLSVVPIGDAQRQTLDFGRQDWPQKMIDHIEALRDNANANDTSLRLKPEALGRVDIALRMHDSGAISVRFTAEQPTTRALLADAAPQLAAAAEARGIRLSGTSVDLSGYGDQRQQAQAERAQPAANRLATVRGDDNQAVDDGRIA